MAAPLSPSGVVSTAEPTLTTTRRTLSSRVSLLMQDFVMGRTVLQLVPACKVVLEGGRTRIEASGIIQNKNVT
jgi:hypothetical protein